MCCPVSRMCMRGEGHFAQATSPESPRQVGPIQCIGVVVAKKLLDKVSYAHIDILYEWAQICCRDQSCIIVKTPEAG